MGGAGCSDLDLGQVGGQAVGEPAFADPEGLGFGRLGVPVMVGSPVAGVLGRLTTSLGAVIVEGLGWRLGGEARKGRNPPSFSYTLHSGLLLLLGCRSAIQRAVCYAEKATQRHTEL